MTAQAAKGTSSVPIGSMHKDRRGPSSSLPTGSRVSERPSPPRWATRREDAIAGLELLAAHRERLEPARQRIAIRAGISQDAARKLHKFVRNLGLKNVTSQTQGDQVRVTGKKRDDLQAVIAACKAEDFGIPLQFENFRD